jgi:hypothetical protein
MAEGPSRRRLAELPPAAPSAAQTCPARLRLRVAEFAMLGVTMTSFPINVFDLGHDDIDGLLGMNFLSELNFEIRPAEQRILVDKIVR